MTSLSSPSRHPTSQHHADDSTESSDESGGEINKPQSTRTRRAYTLSKDFEEDEEKEIVRKLDLKLVLFLSFLYLLSFLDRSNIGNARIAGLEKALDLSDRQFDLCLIAFYVTYITFEWMILLYRLVPAHIYISLCVASWGVVASLQSMVGNFTQLLILRSCLGITEAAFGPGVPLFMSFFYHRSELAYRVGLQVAAAPLATSFASSLAWVIVKLNENGPIEPWRALFLFEGFPSIIAAIFAFYLIPDSPETARFLTPRERKVAKLRLEDRQVPVTTRSKTSGTMLSRIRSSKTISTLSSPMPWLQALMFLSVNVSFASLPVFLPTIINSMSFSATTSQILSAPPYLVSFAFVLVVGRLSDLIEDSRGICLMLCSGLSAVCYFTIALFGHLESAGLISAQVSLIVRYAAVYGAAMGLFSSVVLIITWNLNNQPGKEEKGLAMMVMNLVGQCGPLIGVTLFPNTDGPHYLSGMLVSGFFMLGVVIMAAILRMILSRLNSRRDQQPEYEMVGMVANDSSGAADSLMGENAQPIRTSFRYVL